MLLCEAVRSGWALKLEASVRAAAPLALEAAWNAAVDAEVVLAQAQVTFIVLSVLVNVVTCVSWCLLGAQVPLWLWTELQLWVQRCCCLR